DQEIAARRLEAGHIEASDLDPGDDEPAEETLPDESDPDWIAGSMCACTFSTKSDMDDAYDALSEPAIPCPVVPQRIESADGRHRTDYEMLVPSKLQLKAISVLEKRIFNNEAEAGYRTYFEELSNEELSELDLGMLLAGLQDRIDRIKRVYGEEVAR